MKNIEKEELVRIIGGASISGAVLSGITTLVKYIYVLGQSFGSSVRRLATKKLCSCK